MHRHNSNVDNIMNDRTDAKANPNAQKIDSAPTPTAVQAINDGATYAEGVAVVGWFFVGFFLVGFGLLIVYLRMLRMPLGVLASYPNQENISLYEQSYTERLRSRQVKITWIGFLSRVVLVVLVLCIYTGWLTFLLTSIVPNQTTIL